MSAIIPRKVFFVQGKGFEREKLLSFELALRDAGIEPYNLVSVSSIIPPNCEIIDKDRGKEYLREGEIVFCVMARASTDIAGKSVAASIGIALPSDNKWLHGYIAEHSVVGTSEKVDKCGKHAEELAKKMLLSKYGSTHESGSSRFKSLITKHFSISATHPGGKGWLTVVSAAVFII